MPGAAGLVAQTGACFCVRIHVIEMIYSRRHYTRVLIKLYARGPNIYMQPVAPKILLVGYGNYFHPFLPLTTSLCVTLFSLLLAMARCDGLDAPA